jgi:hypothetical protein
MCLEGKSAVGTVHQSERRNRSVEPKSDGEAKADPGWFDERVNALFNELLKIG